MAIGFFAYALATYKGIPVTLIVLAVLVLVYGIVMNRSVFGRHIYAIGGNLHAAELSGIKTRNVNFWLFVNMGFLAALAGLIFTARLNLAGPKAGDGFELEAISAAFIGGAAVQGGVGTIGGAIIGGLIIGVLNNGMSIMGIGIEWQQAVKGLVLLLRRRLRRLQQAPLRRPLIPEQFSPSPGEIHVVLGVDSPGLDAVLARVAGDVAFAHVRRLSGLTATLDLADNVFLGIEPRRRLFGLPGIVDRASMRTRTTALLRRVDVYTPLPTPAKDLDDASRVLVEVARALAHGATTIALTEPTAGLTDAAAGRVVQVLRRLANDGVAVVIASQRPRLALEIADVVSVLSEGSVTTVLRPGDSRVDARGRLLRAMAGETMAGERWRRDDGGETKAGETMAGEAMAGETKAGEAMAGEAPVGATGPASRDRATESPSAPLVEIVNWSTLDEFDRTTPVVIDASVSAAAGEIVGLAGLEGSGRNELLLSVFGRTAGSEPAGVVLLEGLPVDTSTTLSAIRAGIFAIVTVQPKYRVRIVGGISAPATPSMLPALVNTGLVSRDDEPHPSSPGARALERRAHAGT